MKSLFLNSGLKGFLNLLRNKKIYFVGFIYILLCLIILYNNGIDTSGEASKYIEDAGKILNGEKLRVEFFSIFYVVYSILVSFFLYFSFSLQGIGCLQILFSFIAACCVYKILFDTTDDEKIAFIFFIIYLLCYPVQKWVFYLYTESLHASLTVIGLYFFYCTFQKMELRRCWMLLLFLLLIIFSRPVGMIFLLTLFIVALVKFIRSNHKPAFYLLGIFFSILFIYLLQSQFVFYFNPDSLRRMEIICGVPESSVIFPYKEYNTEGLQSFFQVIFSEIGIKNFLLNGLKKLLSFYGMVRSFYSKWHNISLISTILLLYPMAIAGIFLFKNKKSFYLKAFILIYVLFTSVGIFFTCDEWSNRFVVPLLPQIIILSGMGASWVRNAKAHLLFNFKK